jgi:hypothetical protein
MPEPSRPEVSRALRCGIYTRKSTTEGLEQEFNSLDAQRESAEAYIASQRQAGWTALAERYDDGGVSGASLVAPGQNSRSTHDQPAHAMRRKGPAIDLCQAAISADGVSKDIAALMIQDIQI